MALSNDVAQRSAVSALLHPQAYPQMHMNRGQTSAIFSIRDSFLEAIVQEE